MLQFTAMGFRVGVDPFFWIIMALLGGVTRIQNSDDAIDVVLWVFVAFVSILVHELGHALAAQKFGEHSTIMLHGCGGSTHIPRARFTRGQSIFVSAAGPIASFVLAGITLVAWFFFHDSQYVGLQSILASSLWINIGWTLMNLLPILPMDGGQIFRELLGPRRENIACMVGGTLAAAIAILALMVPLVFLGFTFAYFAWINFSNGTAEGGVMKG